MRRMTVNMKSCASGCATLSLTERNATGQSGALCLAPGGTVALQHTVIQKMARTRVGKRSTFKFYCIHLVDKTKNK